jgi:vitamin B12 transporter
LPSQNSEGNMNHFRHCRTRRKLFYLLLLLNSLTTIAGGSTVRGTITDSLGAVVPKAQVEILITSTRIAATTTDSAGRYEFDNVSPGRYEVRATAVSFDWTTSKPFYVGENANATVDVFLAVGVISQSLTVTATGMPTPQAQIGASVTQLSRDDYADKIDLHDALRLVPGAQLTQTGRRGGLGDLFVRGGNSNANKVVIDDVPVGDIGGAVDFGVFSTVGAHHIEVLRGPNSALYGADALAGVVSITTPRGVTPLPELTYSVDGGNFGTYRQEGTLAGSHKQLDYFSDFGRFDSSNGAVSDSVHNGTFAGNIGWTPMPNTELRATVRRLVAASGQPNAIQLFGIADDAEQKQQETLMGATLEQQTTRRWRNLLRYGALRLRSQFIDFAPTGIPYDPQNTGSPTGYIGAPVTIRGANGYSVSGQAFFQSVQIYPNQFATSTDRDFVYAQTEYQVKPQLTALFGFRYEAERGFTQSSFSKSPTDRGNYSYTLQAAGSIANRFYYTLGGGIENNAAFGVAATPRVSLAYYALRPDSYKIFSGTKVHGSFGTGIKEPSIFNAGNSLFSLLQQLTNGEQLISQFHIAPIGAERSRSYDGGIEQSLFQGRASLGVTYFHNQFSDLLEFVPMQGLIDLGVPSTIASVLRFGATVNSQAYRAQGAEVELECRAGRSLVARGGYTYLDAVVQRSFSSDALGPSFNAASNFSAIPIGVFSPLIGARPFRRAPHSGYLALVYHHARWSASLTGTFVGRRDDSDFLSDKDFGTSLILPNRNLDSAYQKIDVGASRQVFKAISVYAALQNVLSQHYQEAFGFPGLPFTFRSGIRVAIGGELWKLK